MNSNLLAAMIVARSTSAIIEVRAMDAENQFRLAQGALLPAFGKEAYFEILKAHNGQVAALLDKVEASEARARAFDVIKAGTFVCLTVVVILSVAAAWLTWP